MSFNKHFKHHIGQYGEQRTILAEKVRESLVSVLPITLIVLILSFTITPLPNDALLAFILGAVLLIAGMGFFTLGADIALSPLGERVGSSLTKSHNIFIIVIVSFIIGSMITISEPDLQVLAGQVAGIPNAVLIGAVAGGVGIFLVLALLRIIFAIKLSYLIIFFYTIIFVMAAFAPSDFLAIAFDSGGVTTGPMTVPFIMALGVGVSSIRSDKDAGGDSFGLVALCSIGPIIAVLLLSFLYPPAKDAIYNITLSHAADSVELAGLFTSGFPVYLKEIGIAFAPIVLFFIIFQIISMRLNKSQCIKMIIGLVYTYVGLAMFLSGANIGFMQVGSYIGSALAGLPYKWIIIPVAMLIGYFIVAAEPAIHVLNKQVETITSGAIPQRAMNLALSIGVSVSLALAMIRVLTGISILWFMIPGYAIAILLSFFVPKIFTSIAFDSGGVASGPMTATFLLPFAMGACEAVGGNITSDAFGVVAMVAMTPLITIQILGVVYRLKQRSAKTVPEVVPFEIEIIDL